MTRILQLLLLFLVCASCQNKAKSKTAVSETKQEQKSTERQTAGESNRADDGVPPGQSNGDTETTNGITVQQSGGLGVAKAYLTYEDGRLVPPSNKVALGQTVYLNLLIDKGWTVTNGTVSPEATERIETADGRLVLNAPNLFKALPQVDADKAAHIFLKATITATQADIPYFVVNYHLWDKQGNGDVKGRYRLYVEERQK